jgi:hypothetical protein
VEAQGCLLSIALLLTKMSSFSLLQDGELIDELEVDDDVGEIFYWKKDKVFCTSTSTVMGFDLKVKKDLIPFFFLFQMLKGRFSLFIFHRQRIPSLN